MSNLTFGCDGSRRFSLGCSDRAFAVEILVVQGRFDIGSCADRRRRRPPVLALQSWMGRLGTRGFSEGILHQHPGGRSVSESEIKSQEDGGGHV